MSLYWVKVVIASSRQREVREEQERKKKEAEEAKERRQAFKGEGLHVALKVTGCSMFVCGICYSFGYPNTLKPVIIVECNCIVM